MERVKKESVVTQSEELSRYLDGNTVENHENCRSGSNRAPPKYMSESVMSGFPRGVNQIFALLGFYEAYSGNSIPTFRDNLSVPSSRVKQSKKMGLIGCPETLVTTDLRCITSQKSEDLIYMSENYLLYFGI